MKLKRANSYALHALMYMVRHTTQLPLTLQAISKAEGIPYRQLVTLFRLFSEAGIVEHTGSDPGGVVFKRSPAEVSLLEVLEIVEGHPLFDECFLKHTDCPGTAENCIIFASWQQATQSLAKKLSEVSIDKAAWGHPEHFFQNCCLSIENAEEKTS
ncbi:MAG: RrF2 family transcriptional regulator [Planctomycetota bacterium]|jgi:Rrf2 family protein